MPKRALPFEVRESAIQGRGAYATRRIAGGAWIVEYTGELITQEEADRRYADEAMERHHTFLFDRHDGRVIDAASGGSDARFINHSCEPNCEAIVESDTRAIWICARRTIEAGEELTYDYGYALDGENPETAKRRYPCRCGASRCRGTILAI